MGEGALQRNTLNDRANLSPPSYRQEVKCLLLGSGESGKSTILKQMRLLSDGSHTDEERMAYREIILANAVQSMQVVVDAMDDLGLSLPPDVQRHAALFSSLDIQPDVMDHNGDMYEDLRDGIIALWKLDATRECISKSYTFQLNDSAPYYFDAASRIGQKGYVPTDQDILRSRVKTTGITEAVFKISGKVTFRCFDVGGQRSERKKWIHCFENVQCLFFVVAISEYNQLLAEDTTTNRVVEAATLFDSIANSRWFQNSGVLLFLNKTDLLASKLLLTSFSDSFPDFTGSNTPTDVQQYMLNKFRGLYRHKWREIIAHFTCATDTNQMSVVLAAVEQHIIVSNLAKTGML
ncbi:G protein alpha-subunit [Leucosporidium creatinivorum]|uniref:G protein alpha-subunit n=1 Tax=Leucosporidium creatinivorum TaxID=106004 RepID=A0A1Y2ETA4_9BASI|nr:G protein alpha-subunit [Leucosporidium creatinivorum]